MYTFHINWKNLKENKCPNCSKDWFENFGYDSSARRYKCRACGFIITAEKYKEIKLYA